MSSDYSPCSKQNQECRQQCQEVNCQVDSWDQRQGVRFFLIIGALATLALTGFVVFACFFPSAVFSALAAFLWVLGARLLGKDLP